MSPVQQGQCTCLHLHAQVFDEGRVGRIFDGNVGKLGGDDWGMLWVQSGRESRQSQSRSASWLAFQQQFMTMANFFWIRGFLEKRCDPVAITDSFTESTNVIKAVQKCLKKKFGGEITRENGVKLSVKETKRTRHAVAATMMYWVWLAKDMLGSDTYDFAVCTENAVMSWQCARSMYVRSPEITNGTYWKRTCKLWNMDCHAIKSFEFSITSSKERVISDFSTSSALYLTKCYKNIVKEWWCRVQSDSFSV